LRQTYESRLKAGDRLILAAFGGGFTWGGAYLTWANDGSKRTSRGDQQMPKRNDSL